MAKILAHRADIMSGLTVVNERVAGMPLEPRAATAEFDPTSWASYHAHLRVAERKRAAHTGSRSALGVDRGRVRVVTYDVGGAFGLKTPVYPLNTPHCSSSRRGW